MANFKYFTKYLQTVLFDFQGGTLMHDPAKEVDLLKAQEGLAWRRPAMKNTMGSGIFEQNISRLWVIHT